MSDALPIELISDQEQPGPVGIAELVAEIRLLRAELVLLHAVARSTCGHSAEIRRLLDRACDDGVFSVRSSS